MTSIYQYRQIFLDLRYLGVITILYGFLAISTTKAEQLLNENSVSTQVIDIANELPDNPVGKFTYFYEDIDASLNFEQIKSLKESRWQLSDRDVPSFGFVQSIIWLRIDLENLSQKQKDFLLSIDNSALDEIRVFLKTNTDSQQSFVMGDSFPFDHRKIDHRHFIIPLEMASNSTARLYIRVANLGSMQIPVFFRDAGSFAMKEQSLLLGWGMFFGIMLIMSLYNFILFSATGDKSYFLFSLYIVSMLFFQLSLYGLGFQYVWPDFQGINRWMIPVSVAFLYASGCGFMQSFIQIKQFSLLQHVIVKIIMYTALLGAVISPFIPYQYSMPSLTFVAVPFSTMGVIVSATALYNGLTSARFFLWSWIIFTSFLFILAINKLGIIPRNIISENGIQLGSVLSVLFMSVALADRINLDKKQRIEANKEAMRLEKIASKEHELFLQSEISRKEEELKTQQTIITAREEVLLAKAQNETKSDFLATMSHEIRTPLHGILGMSDMLFESKLDNQQRDYLQVIKSSGSSLLNIINDILDFSKIEAGRMEIEYRIFDLQETCKETLDSFYLLAKDKKMSVRCDISDNMPEFIKSDSNRLQQILLNLISNAIKFSDGEDVKLRTSIVASTSNENTNSSNRPQSASAPLIKFEVIDHGIGISAEHQQKLFKSFSQADGSTTRKYGGTGLGLSICKRLVALMGGTIGVESSKGKGSTFWFTIKCGEMSSSELESNIGAIKTARIVPSQSFDRLQGLKVLIAEDNKINQMVIKGLASKLGLISVVVENGLMAVEYVQENYHHIDFVLMDCEMPILDGYDASKQIRQWEQSQNLPPLIIYAVTAHALDEHIKISQEAKMDGHISKPVNLKTLYRAIIENERIAPLLK